MKGWRFGDQGVGALRKHSQTGACSVAHFTWQQVVRRTLWHHRCFAEVERAKL